MHSKKPKKEANGGGVAGPAPEGAGAAVVSVTMHLHLPLVVQPMPCVLCAGCQRPQASRPGVERVTRPKAMSLKKGRTQTKNQKAARKKNMWPNPTGSRQLPPKRGNLDRSVGGGREGCHRCICSKVYN